MELTKCFFNIVFFVFEDLRGPGDNVERFIRCPFALTTIMKNTLPEAKNGGHGKSVY